MKKSAFLVAISQCLLVLTLLLTACGGEPGTGETPSKPNIILVFLDDAGYADFGVTGSTTPTPTIDALARNGVQFTQFYDASPVCSASRAALLTGRYPDRFSFTNVFFPDDTQFDPLSAVVRAEDSHCMRGVARLAAIDIDDDIAIL